jgi:hypothetical protein
MTSHITSQDASPLAGQDCVDLQQHFDVLVCWWREATDYLSSPTEKANHPAYKKIIELGPIVISYILRDLEERGGSGWYIALRRLTGATPVPPEAATNSRRVRELWLAWGRANGFI